MTTIILDIATLFSKDAFHQAICNALSLPPYYGSNLDALFDCLSDISSDTQLILQHAASLEENLGAYGCGIQQVLQAAAQNNPHFSFVLEN